MNNEIIKLLKSELARRVEKNPRYSMRSFALSLGLNIGALSRLLNGKRRLTLGTADQICSKLGMSPIKKSEILLSSLGINDKELNYENNRVLVEEEIFRIISDWHHYAILQLVRTKGYLRSANNSNPKWIARHLKISELDAKLALERLVELKFLEKNKAGFFERTKKNFASANVNVTSLALKNSQKQTREKAIWSLENDPIEVRSMTSMTMAINPKKIKEAKRLIDEFQERLAEFLEKDEKLKVYQLCVSLFPLQALED